MNTDPRLDVAQTIHDFTYHLDEGQMERVAGLFVPDGIWVRGGQRCVGPEGVLAALPQRSSTLETRHLAGNMVVRAGEGGRYQARYYLTVYDYDGPADGTPALSLPPAIFVSEDDLVNTTDGWRFVRRKPRQVFKR